jgi:O-antigen/teichoic acid export membrane protein
VTFQGIGYSAVLRAFEEMGWDILGFSLHKLIFLLLVWGVSRTDWGLQGVSAAMLLANACQWLYLEGLVGSRHGWARPSLELRAAWGLFSEAFPLGIAEMLRRLARHVDKLLLAALSTPIAVGIFSAAYKLLDAIDPFTLTLPLFPVFSRFARDSPGKLFRAYEQSLKFMYVVSMPCAVLLFALAERIMVLCFGNAYGEGAIALQLLAPTMVVLLPKAIYGYVFTALGHQRLYMGCIGMALVVNTVVDLLLIPYYGYVGAAIGTLVGEAVLFLSGLIMLRQLGSSLDSLRSIGRPLLAGFAMGLVCWEVKDRALASLLLGVFSGLVTYGGLLLIFQTFTRQELILLRQSMRVRLGSVTR